MSKNIDFSLLEVISAQLPQTALFSMSRALWFWDKRAMFWNCTRCPKLSPLSGEVVIQCGTIWSPKGFDISRLCHSNLSRSEGHSFLSMAKKGFSGGQLHLELEQQNQNPMAFSIRLPDSWSQNTKSWAFEPFLFRRHLSSKFFLAQQPVGEKAAAAAKRIVMVSNAM